MESNNDLVFRLRERARIRRQIPTRKSVQNGEPDRIADLLEEAADEIIRLKTIFNVNYGEFKAIFMSNVSEELKDDLNSLYALDAESELNKICEEHYTRVKMDMKAK